MKRSTYFKAIIALFVTGILSSGLKEQQPLEDIAILSGIGYDLNKGEKGKFTYSVPISYYLFEQGTNNIMNTVITGVGDTPTESRENRQLKINKKAILGLERIYAIPEDTARLGIYYMINVLFLSPFVNDTGYVVVCKESAAKLLGLKVKGYTSSAEYIEGMIRNSIEFNFFPDKFKLSDLYKCFTAEGDTFFLPYIEIKSGLPQITGLALFAGDKMVDKLDIDDMKLFFMLRGKVSEGMLSLEKDPKKYIEYNPTLKTSVKLENNSATNKLKFKITLDFNGDITSDTLFKGLDKDINVQKQFQDEMKAKVTRDIYEFIERMKAKHEADIFGFGKYIAAKEGRHEVKDLNKQVMNAEYEVNVNIKIDRLGRGIY